jgi:hypothetical protein
MPLRAVTANGGVRLFQMMLVGFFSILFQTLIWFIRPTLTIKSKWWLSAPLACNWPFPVQEAGVTYRDRFFGTSDANEIVAYILTPSDLVSSAGSALPVGDIP